MNTPEKCPKCGQALKGGFSDVYNCDSAFEEDDDGWFLAQSYHCVAIQRDQLAERVRELEAWKESVMAVEREWDPNQLAAMLGGQLGEPQRAVIQQEVPRLVERVRQLESAYAECTEKLYRAEQREHDLKRRLDAVSQELRRSEERTERAEERVKRLEEAAGLALGYAAKGDFETADEVLNQAKSQP